jgi:putative FmdB family regulatory protein
VPIFEFRCRGCGKKFATLVGMTADGSEVVCPECGSKEADKLVSRFRQGRTEDDRLDDLADRLEQYGEPESHSQMREMMREIGKAVDEDMADDMEEMFEADMAGELGDEL